MVFTVNSDGGANLGPIKDLGGFFGFHIDTTVRHGDAEIIVPVGTMKTESDAFGVRRVMEKHNVGYVGQIVISAQGLGAAGHFLGADFGPDGKSAIGGTIPLAGGNEKIKNLSVAFIGIKTLGGKVNLNALIAGVLIGFTKDGETLVKIILGRNG